MVFARKTLSFLISSVNVFNFYMDLHVYGNEEKI